MGLLDSIKGIAGSAEDRVARLSAETAAVEKELYSEAGKLGIKEEQLNPAVDPGVAEVVFNKIQDTYLAARKKDIDEYNSSIQLDIDSLQPLAERLINWQDKYKEMTNKLLGRF